MPLADIRGNPSPIACVLLSICGADVSECVRTCENMCHRQTFSEFPALLRLSYLSICGAAVSEYVPQADILENPSPVAFVLLSVCGADVSECVSGCPSLPLISSAFPLHFRKFQPLVVRLSESIWCADFSESVPSSFPLVASFSSASSS